MHLHILKKELSKCKLSFDEFNKAKYRLLVNPTEEIKQIIKVYELLMI